MLDRRNIIRGGLALASASLLSRTVQAAMREPEPQNVIKVSFENFGGILGLLSKSAPTVFTIGASWCTPCQMLDASMDSFVTDMKRQIRINWLQTDVDNAKEIGAAAFLKQWNVPGFPYSGLYYGGVLVENSPFDGYKDAEGLKKWYQAIAPQPLTLQSILPAL